MRLTFLLLAVTISLTLVACGGGGHSALAPVFTSSPGLAATQDISYTYNISATDPSGGTFSFALSSGPSGATLNGSTLLWTPSAVQSRVSDGFIVTATSSEGGRATQSWSIVPSGTINGTWVNTRWTAAGSTNQPVDWTKLHFLPQALVPNPDGTFLVIQGSGNADGTFSIPAVPGGYFWLQLGFRSFWTSSSSFDYGTDIVGRAPGTVPAPERTTFAFNIASLDPVESGDQFAFLTDWAAFASSLDIGFPITSPPGSTTLAANYTVDSNIDYSTADTAFLLQYEPVSAGAVTGSALGPELTLSDLSLASGITNNVVESLNTSPHFSFDLNVKGSQWAPLFQNVGPSPVTPVDAYISMSARPFAPQSVLGAPLNLPLFLPPLIANNPGVVLFGWPTAGTCTGDVPINPPFLITSYSPMLTDQDFGMLTYGDPFDPNWVRVFSLCQTASVQVPVPGGGTPATFYFQDGVNMAIPTSPIAPLALPVQNPTLNGSSLFATSTVSPTGVSLRWAGSAGATAYTVALLRWATLPDGSLGYLRAGEFHTAKTSMTLPVLQAGQTYVIVLTTEVDGRANVETSPYRSALPTAVASVVSAPFTTNSGSQPRASVRNR